MTETILRITVLLLVAMAVLQAIVLIALMRQVGGIMLQLRPARFGEMEHDEGPEVGLVVDIPRREDTRPAIALFLSPACRICQPLLPAIPALAGSYPEIDVIPVVIGADESDRERYARQIGPLARTDLHDLENAWNIPGTPFAVGIDGDGRVEVRGVVNS